MNTLKYCLYTLMLTTLSCTNAETKETTQSTPDSITDALAQDPETVTQEQPIEEPPAFDEEPGMDMPLMPLPPSYFLKNTIELNEGLNCMVAKSEKVFDEYFGVAATMGEQVEEIDFQAHYVLAIAMHTKNEIVELAIERAELKDGNLKVWCMIQKLEEDKGYESTPIALAAVPKEENIKTVSFYNKDKLIRKVDL